jgi:hypothetical protein
VTVSVHAGDKAIVDTVMGTPMGVSPGRQVRKSMSTEPMMSGSPYLELPVEELLRRARPLPPHEEMVIEDLDDEEGAAFLSTLVG